MYFIAFLCLYNDFIPLLSSKGLLPVNLYLNRIHDHFEGEPFTAFWELPSIFHVSYSDTYAQGCIILRLILSICIMLDFQNMLMLFACWILYFSFVSVGQRWYSFGWEFQLAEYFALPSVY